MYQDRLLRLLPQYFGEVRVGNFFSFLCCVLDCAFLIAPSVFSNISLHSKLAIKLKTKNTTLSEQF